MKRIFLLVFVAISLCGCTFFKTIEPPTVPIDHSPKEISARQTLVFLINQKEDAVFKAAAQKLSVKASEITGGDLTIELVSCDDALSDLAQGKGQLAFLDSQMDVSYCQELAILTAPFRFKDYKQFTMALNSTRMINFLNDRFAQQSPIRLLAGFYGGSNQILSREPTVGGNLPITDDYGDQNTLLLLEQSLSGVVTEYGMQAGLEPDYNERLRILHNGSAIASEFSTSELMQMDVEEGQFYLYQLNHIMYSKWLVADHHSYSAFPEEYRAVVQEATAYLFEDIDRYYIGLENEAADRLKSQGVVTNRTFSGLSETAKKMNEYTDTMDYSTKRVVQIINDMS